MDARYRLWVRFETADRNVGFGTLHDGQIAEHRGDMFGAPEATGRVFTLDAVKLLRPMQPGKVIALWNNFTALGDKLGLAAPTDPLYFLKAPNSFADPGDAILQPRSKGKVVFEGELAIVIGKTASGVGEADAMAHVFGYTCVNDVTEAEVLNRDASFTQWTRAKGMDGFCPLGPAIATGLDAAKLVVRSTLNGELRQNFPIADMRFSVAQIVSLISNDMTLDPGDAILCGTSIGVGSMKPGSNISIQIEGIGTLSNRYVARD